MAFDPLEELARLPQLDVSPETAARIRDAALASPKADAAPGWAVRFERFWTSFIELPSTALVVIVYLVWAVQAASGSPSESHGMAMEAPNGVRRVIRGVSAQLDDALLPHVPHGRWMAVCLSPWRE
jgi:hypothetical protein